ncbi:hypothetical protein Tco_0408405 [Tanacetum coccineum]
MGVVQSGWCAVVLVCGGVIGVLVCVVFVLCGRWSGSCGCVEVVLKAGMGCGVCSGSLSLWGVLCLCGWLVGSVCGGSVSEGCGVGGGTVLRFCAVEWDCVGAVVVLLSLFGLLSCVLWCGCAGVCLREFFCSLFLSRKRHQILEQQNPPSNLGLAICLASSVEVLEPDHRFCSS